MKRVRFAPSPTGFIHVGNARTAVFNYLYSKKNNGKFILRIEDTDLERSKKEYEDNLIKDLEWLGLEWDEGPVKGGDTGPYRQSERNVYYDKYKEQLIESGKAYYCFCSVEELEKEKTEAKAKGENIIYSGKCRDLDPEESKKRVKNGEKASVRFRAPKGKTISFNDLVRDDVSFESDLIGDMIIVRSNGIPAYNFAVVIDDFLMKIDMVIRGEDHLSNTFKQVLLFNALDFQTPGFAHLSMVMGEDSTKLSKRHGSVSISEFRKNGYLPEALFNYLSLLGWSPGDNREIFLKKELVSAFNIKKVSKSSAIFDYQKLKWINREHIRKMSKKELGLLVAPFLEEKGISFKKEPEIMEWIGQAAGVLSNYEYTLEDISSGFSQFSTTEFSKEVNDGLKRSDSAMTVLKLLYSEIENISSPVSFEVVLNGLKKIQEKSGIKGKELYHPIRLALTGKDKGIELKDFIPVVEEGSVREIKPPIINMKERIGKIIK
ncbi:MAG: glutamate--tRNA ligase [Acidobacteriota bacterium]